MKKTLKLTALGIILTIAIMCMGIFAAACNKDDDNKEATEFKITVVYEDGKAVNGKTDGTYGINTQTGGQGTEVKIQVCDADTGNYCYTPILLGEDGKITVSISEVQKVIPNVENFTLHILGLPTGYEVKDDIMILNKQNPNITVTLKAKAN